jgi:hypothetical protein
MRRRLMIIGVVVSVLSLVHTGYAATDFDNPEHWSFEVRGGHFGATGTSMKKFFGGCCHGLGMMTVGVLIDSKLGFDVGMGIFRGTGEALGNISGLPSQETFSLLLVPMTLEATYRIDYHKGQPMAPFFKGGLDFIVFREGSAGTTTKGFKSGAHGGGGLMILLNDLADGQLDTAYGLNDLFFVVDGRYQWVNNFGGGGLDLSGWALTGGVHLQF